MSVSANNNIAVEAIKHARTKTSHLVIGEVTVEPEVQNTRYTHQLIRKVITDSCNHVNRLY